MLGNMTTDTLRRHKYRALAHPPIISIATCQGVHLHLHILTSGTRAVRKPPIINVSPPSKLSESPTEEGASDSESVRAKRPHRVSFEHDQREKCSYEQHSPRRNDSKPVTHLGLIKSHAQPLRTLLFEKSTLTGIIFLAGTGASARIIYIHVDCCLWQGAVRGVAGR